MKKRALISVSDKTGVDHFANELVKLGYEIIASGGTRKLLESKKIQVTPVEKITGSPEIFDGRVKTLSYQLSGAILFDRNKKQDVDDAKRVGIDPIDLVIVNFYPFKEASNQSQDIGHLIHNTDIGGPTLVRAAAKNYEHVGVVTDVRDYDEVIAELSKSHELSLSFKARLAQKAWLMVSEYDQNIALQLGAALETQIKKNESNILTLRYGENPHQKGFLQVINDQEGLDWKGSLKLSAQELSYNNILDLSSGYALICDLVTAFPDYSHCVVIKHNNPCGVGSFKSPNKTESIEKAFNLAWEGDPISAFGGVLLFSDPISNTIADIFKERFIELIAAPNLTSQNLNPIQEKRKKLKAVKILDFKSGPETNTVNIPGGRLTQGLDLLVDEKWEEVAGQAWDDYEKSLSRFGVCITKAMKSNAISIVRGEYQEWMQLIGAGQGQPNRIEALKKLAVPRALTITKDLKDCILVSDAFFPFADSVDACFESGIRKIVQPGGSIKDQEVIARAKSCQIKMALTRVRHFKH